MSDKQSMIAEQAKQLADLLASAETDDDRLTILTEALTDAVEYGAQQAAGKEPKS